MTNDREKEAFLNMMSLVSDYPKYVMLEKFLEGSFLTVKNFTSDGANLPARVVYQTLRKWRKAQILEVDESSGPNRLHRYRLNADKLLEKLS